MKTAHHLCLIIILSLILLPLQIYSQTSQSKIENLTKQADVILTGKVIEQKSEWNNNQTRISTQTTIQVDEYLKGNEVNKSIIITTPGGEVGDVGELYTHMPKFSKEEDVLLFVKRDRNNTAYKIVDGEDGKLTLYKDQKTGETVTSFNKKISSLKQEIKNYVTTSK